MAQQILDLWPIIATLAGLLVTEGVAHYRLGQLEKWRDKREAADEKLADKLTVINDRLARIEQALNIKAG